MEEPVIISVALSPLLILPCAMAWDRSMPQRAALARRLRTIHRAFTWPDRIGIVLLVGSGVARIVLALGWGV